MAAMGLPPSVSGLRDVVEVVKEWGPRALSAAVVLQALDQTPFRPVWSSLELYTGMSTDLRASEPMLQDHEVARTADSISGWPALASAIWGASTSGRMALLRAALGFVNLDELRELVALLLLLSKMFSPTMVGVPPAGGHVARALDVNRIAGLGRLQRDLLACNRLLEEAGPKLQVLGLHMPGVRLTEEQAQIVLKNLAPNELLLISAFAGTGKTSTLRMYSLMRPHLQILYLCFNVSVREEAQRGFPKNVTCKSVHQLAYASCGYRFGHKLCSDDLRAEDMVSKSLFDPLASTAAAGAHSGRKGTSRRQEGGGTAMQRLEGVEACLATLRGFLNSADGEVSEKHLPSPRPGILVEGSISEDLVCDLAKELWRRMCDPKDSEVRMTHGGYLKLYSLSKPRLKYDLVLLDEAQDCNPAIASVVTSQSCARILVGDEHQAIYGFLGAQDMLKDQRVQAQGSCGAVIRRQLTRSFRFGPHVADLANFVLRSFVGEARPVLGCGSHEGDILPPGGDTGEGVPQRPFAFIARTNTSILKQALRCDEMGWSLEWVGGVKGYKLGLLRDLCLLSMGQRDRVESGRIKAFPSLAAVQNFARRVEDRELVARTELVLRSNAADLLQRLERIEAAAERREKACVAQAADVALSTVHKAKGLEWDTVVVADDFLDLTAEASRVGLSGSGLTESPTWPGDVQELNMLYVALTRCKRRLQLPGSLAGLYALQAEAVALVELSGFAASADACAFCGVQAVGLVQDTRLLERCRPLRPRLVSSVTLRALCSNCSQQTSLGNAA
ncbi:unnamed protein product [Polarella glacialis]|uniref:DNA 3'-5' helicase n=1 Tax=Polarella glacialis TaxID=89957 RepID=A0A813DDB3_POLGL|nr:unnamed protein product [Polarella glacialis]